QYRAQRARAQERRRAIHNTLFETVDVELEERGPRQRAVRHRRVEGGGERSLQNRGRPLAKRARLPEGVQGRSRFEIVDVEQRESLAIRDREAARDHVRQLVEENVPAQAREV